MPFRKVVLMYHSVSGPAAPAVAGGFPVPLERFKYQVQQACRQGWQLGRLSDLRKPVSADTLYVTGDDGTVDWAHNVLPWCEQHAIPTHTALITGPWLDEPIYPVAHRLQILLSLRGHELPVPSLSGEQRAYVDRIYAYEKDPHRRYLKGACNLVFDDAEARQLLGPPSPEEERLLSVRFAPPEAYRGYQHAEFGVHTVSHRAFGGDPEAYVREEVLPCRDAMIRHGLQPTRYLVLPMRPRFGATVEQIAPYLQAAGFEGTLEALGEWDGQSFAIPRLDAKDMEQYLGLEPWAEDCRPEPPITAVTQRAAAPDPWPGPESVVTAGGVSSRLVGGLKSGRLA
jgi:peptidoglycan/xylan/chitin deacetylase (PgdA/CDA1 family)